MSDAANKTYTATEIRARVEAWHARQIETISRAHGRSWPKHADWIESYLKAEIRERLHALGWRAKS